MCIVPMVLGLMFGNDGMWVGIDYMFTSFIPFFAFGGIYAWASEVEHNRYMARTYYSRK